VSVHAKSVAAFAVLSTTIRTYRRFLLQIRDGRSRLVVAAQATRLALRHQGFKEALDKLTPIRFTAG